MRCVVIFCNVIGLIFGGCFLLFFLNFLHGIFYIIKEGV